MKFYRWQFKKIFVVIFFISIFSYTLFSGNVQDYFDANYRHQYADFNERRSYFVNTKGCQIPQLDVMNDYIQKFVKKPHSFECKKPLTRTLNEGSIIVLNLDDQNELMKLYNISDIREVSCLYREITRKTDKLNEFGVKVPFQLQFNEAIAVQPDIEFVIVKCQDKNDINFYTDYHFFVLDKSKELGESHAETIYNAATQKAGITGEPGNFKSEELSVMLLGIDTLSHLNFLRQLNNSASFIKSQLSHIDFWGYNKVGDNTWPNLVPLFSGLDVDELKESCFTTTSFSKSYFDNCSFIWQRYKDAGFKTVYAEDVAGLALFNHWGTGFAKQPTDYYLRPIMLEMERHIAGAKYGNVKLCMGGRCTVDVVLEYAHKFIPLMRQQRFFSFFWTLVLTHDDLNLAISLDTKLLELLQAFESGGIFNNTLVFLLSDHGLRWGSFRNTYQGMIEERQPLLMPIYPEWMKKNFPMAIANLEQNAHRLTTPFDLHETLQDLLNLQNIKDEVIARRSAALAEVNELPRGISLFLEIPETRTCENAGVAAHWCCCYQRSELQIDDDRVQRAARYIVKLINERIEHFPQCRALELHSISKAYLSEPHHKIVEGIAKNDYEVDVTVTIQTLPGLAIYEATVRMSKKSSILTGTISRLNLYASQSYCIDDIGTKMFCVCL